MNPQLCSCAGNGCDCRDGTATNVVTDVDSDSSSDLDSKTSYGTIPHSSEKLSSHIYLLSDTTLDQQPVERGIASHQLVHLSDTSSNDWTAIAFHPQNDDQATPEEPPICIPQHLQSEVSFSNSRGLPLGESQQCAECPASLVASTSSCKSNKETVKANPKAQRARFLLFIKILFKYLVRVDEHLLHDRAKGIVLECTQRNRMGDPRYTPLVEAMERQLKPCVGDLHWRQAALLLRHFETRQCQV
jgi:hypothetical protein